LLVLSGEFVPQFNPCNIFICPADDISSDSRQDARYATFQTLTPSRS
jgi:hypothetical protein